MPSLSAPSLRCALPVACATCAGVALVTACAGNVLHVGSDESSGGSIVSGTAPSASYGAAQVQAALARCAEPHGPVDTYDDVAGVESRIEGGWLLCDPQDAGSALGFAVPSSTFAADGTWRALASRDGGLVAAQGIGNQGTYRVFATNDASTSCPGSAGADGGSFCGVEIDWPGIFQAGADFETSPRRMLFGGEWFVSLEGP